jgi:hypothetical protein
MESNDLLYLIEAVGCNVVKIGRTADIDKRLSTLSTSHYAELKVLGVCYEADKEKQLHNLMTRFRIRGEWFTWNDESKVQLDELCKRLGIQFKSITELVGDDIWKDEPQVVKLPVAGAIYATQFIDRCPFIDKEKLKSLPSWSYANGQRWYRGEDLIALIVCDER